MIVNVLHIGKTGGTALQAILKSKKPEIQNAGFQVKWCGHKQNVEQIKSSDRGQIVFFVRHPVSRFVSSFNSRLRQGLPSHDSPWKKAEVPAFGMFKEPDALASALDSDDLPTRTAAQLAMYSIQHVKVPLRWAIGDVKELKRSSDLIFFIGAQETYDADCKALLRKFGASDNLPVLDDQQQHKAPSGLSTGLSARARTNLEAWYADDLALYEWCMKNRDAINARAPNRALLSVPGLRRKALNHLNRLRLKMWS